MFEYAPNLQTLNDWVSISSFLLGGSILIFVINFVWSTVIVREREEGNPWQSRGLEWQISSPPPPGNFEHGSRSCCPARTSTARRTPSRSPT